MDKKIVLNKIAVCFISAGATAVTTLSGVFPSWAHGMAAYGGLSILVIGAAYLIYDFILVNLQWNIKVDWNSLPPFKVLIPLKKAVQIAYDENRRTSHPHLIELLSGTLTNGDDLRLQHFAEALSKGRDIYGFYGLGSNLEKLDKNSMGIISKNCESTEDSEGNIIYSGLKIAKSDVEEYIRSLG